MADPKPCKCSYCETQRARAACLEWWQQKRPVGVVAVAESRKETPKSDKESGTAGVGAPSAEAQPASNADAGKGKP